MHHERKQNKKNLTNKHTDVWREEKTGCSKKAGGKNATFFIRSDPRSLNREINVYIYSYVSSAGVTIECVTRTAVKTIRMQRIQAMNTQITILKELSLNSKISLKIENEIIIYWLIFPFTWNSIKKREHCFSVCVSQP